MSDELKATVREKYGRAALTVVQGQTASCCDRGAGERRDPITGGLYDAAETRELPAEAVAASLGCGNPTALAELRPGEVVLDLGSGGGIDVLLSAQRVGPTGKAYGLDMTDEMLALARANASRAGATNVEFLKGEIEAVPLPDASVDVIISNCVINLSPDKDRVLAEAHRVLRPGGRFAVSDIVVRGPVPDAIRRSVEAWIGCVAGALEEADYRARLERAGFVDVQIEPTRVYRAADVHPYLAQAGFDADVVAPVVDGTFMSAFVRARKADGRPVGLTPRVHVHLAVADLARSREFYERFLGGPPAKVKPGYVKFLPAWGPLNLALSAGAEAAGSIRGAHLGLQLGSRQAVVAQLERVRAAGLAVREELGVDCCHANQDKFWVADPDGLEWEVYVLNRDLEDDDGPARGAEARRLAVAPAGGCCTP